MSAEALIAEAVRRRDARLHKSPLPSAAKLYAPLLHALMTLHEVALSSTASPLELVNFSRAVRRTGRRLEDIADSERPRPLAAFIASTVEPDIIPLADAVAALLGHAHAPGGDPVFADVAEALAVVVETELGPALASTCQLPSFELPRPWRTTFQPQRHQLLERGDGPRDVVVSVERCGRVGVGGRLLDPALVIVGGAA